MKKIVFLFIGFFVVNFYVYSQQIVGGEYFIGEDPGVGKAVSFNLNSADSVYYIKSVLINNLNPGIHNLSIRFIDINGLWSHTSTHVFYLSDIKDQLNAPIVKGEIFYVNDPGIGSGIALELNKADSVSSKFHAGIGNLSTGTKIAGVRLMDSLGRWSHTYAENFNVCFTDGTISNFSFINTGNNYTFFDSSYNATNVKWFYTDRNEGKFLFSTGRNPSKILSPGTYYFQQRTTNICDTTDYGIYIIVNGVKRNRFSLARLNDRTLEIRGGGFRDTTEFYLKYSSPDTNYVVYPERKYIENSIMSGIFDLSNAYLGDYDLFVEKLSDPITKTDSVQRYVNVYEPVIGGIYKVDIQSPDVMRTGREREISSIIYQDGNVNLSTEPLFLEFDPLIKDVKIGVDEVLPNHPILDDDFDDFDKDFFEEQKSIDIIAIEEDGKKQYKLYPYLFNQSVDNKINIKIRSNNSGKQKMCMSYFGSDIGKKKNKDSISKCLTFLTMEVLDMITGDQADELAECMNDILGKLLEEALPVIYKDMLEDPSDKINQPDTTLERKRAIPVSNIATSVKSSLEKCAQSLFIAGISSEFAMIKALKKLYDILNKIEDASEKIDGVAQCVEAFGIIDRKCFELNFASSIDPNDKTGISNIQDKNYVKSNEYLPYLIRFENLDTAVLSAQEVIILDTLDKETLDFSTFYFDKFTIGDITYNLEDEPSKFSIDLDRRPDEDYIIRITGDLDTASGEVRVVYLTLDPVTLELTQNDTLGFLPPNKVSPEGEGSVSYYIMPNSNVSSGDNITNKANIFFDVNPPILTNEWKVTIDDIKPMSIINPIDSIFYSDSVMIVFNGQDAIGKIAGYHLMVSEMDQEFKLHSINRGLDTIYFKGSYDSTYKFYSLAFDYAGNIENLKMGYDTYTTLRKLNPPTLITPADSSYLVDVRPLFVWDSAQYSLKYQLQLSDTSDFSNLIFDNPNLIGQGYQAADSLQYNKKYYWRMRSINGVFNSAWSPIFSFTTIEEPANVPDTWTFTDNTGVSSNIVIPSSIMPKVGDRYIAKGDAVGLFFTRDDSLVCAGYGVWNSQDLNITVWGDNPATQMKDGFATNEVYIFRVWDAQQSRERKGLVEYESGNNFFTNAANSILKKLFTNETQSLIVKQGWNYISSYIIPDILALENVLADYSEKLLILKTIKGQTYIPQYDINTIGNWNNLEAYQGYFTQVDTINLNGETIIPENSPIILNTGWSLVPYLRNINGAVEDNLNSIVENDGGLLIAKTISGSVYIPSFGINTIGTLKSGEGYQMYLTRKDTLIYPANSFGKLSFGKLTPNPIYLKPKYSSTGSSSNLIITTNANDYDEFGIYNQNDDLIGSGIVHQGKVAITIWGDNDQTEIFDGAKLNEELSLKHYNIKNGLLQEIDLLLINQKGEINSGSLKYKNDGISFGKVEISEIKDELSLDINPNPASTTFEISYNIGNANNCTIKIYNNKGVMVDEIINLNDNKYTYDSNKLSTGTYTVILNCEDQVLMRKLIIAK